MLLSVFNGTEGIKRVGRINQPDVAGFSGFLQWPAMSSQRERCAANLLNFPEWL
jgi:hypothetical protein